MTISTECAPWSVETFPDGQYHFRPLVGAELGTHLMHINLEGACDMTGAASVKIDGSREHLSMAVRKAWLRLRFERPAIGCGLTTQEVQVDEKTIPLGIRYRTISSQEEEESWLDASIVTVKHNCGPQAYVESLLKHQNAKFDVDNFAYKLHHLIGDDQDHFIFAGTHANIDAMCVALYMDLFLSRLVIELDLAERDVQVSLPWGKELSRLPIMFLDGLGVDATKPLSQEQTMSMMKSFGILKAGLAPSPIGIKTQKTDSAPTTKQIREVFSVAETSRILKALKTHGLTISHATQAAIILAMPGDLPSSFAWPVGIPSWRMAYIPEHLRERITGAIESHPTMITIPSSDLMELAQSAKISFKSLVNIDPALHLPYWNRVNQAIPSWGAPPEKLGPPVLSSLGDLSKYMNKTYSANGHSITLTHYSLAVRLSTPGINYHMWSLNGQLYLQLSYHGGVVPDSEMEALQQRVIKSLRSVM